MTVGTSWTERALAVMLLWISFSAIEAVLVGKIDPQETPVGLAIAAIAAFVTVGSLAAAGVRYAVPISAAAQFPALVWSVLRDTVLITGVLLRALGGKPPEDRLQRIPFDPGGDGAVSAARRALAVAGTSAAPNSVVVDADAEHGVLIVHLLAR